MEDTSAEIAKDTGVESQSVKESDNMRLWGEIIHREARSLLSRYLPEALPQEPTEILFDITPGYRGKFRGKHYIAMEKPVLSYASLKRTEEMLRGQKEKVRIFEGEMREWVRLIKEKAAKGEFDFEDIEKEVFRPELEPEPEPKPEPEDWEEPERLLKGVSEFSIDSWRGVHTLVHELIHQKQAELAPTAFPELSSPELDNIDPDNVDRVTLKALLTEAHKEYSRTQADSLYYPVIEGMAVVGSFYVMGRFSDDLSKSGQTKAAEKLKYARNQTIHRELIETNREMRTGNTDDYNIYYLEGMRMMRRLYRRFGIESLPQMLSSVDLNACRNITKGSAEYQRTLDDPSLLPGLQELHN